MTPRQIQYWQNIPGSWQIPLESICKNTKIDSLLQYLKMRKDAGAVIYPDELNILAALRATSFNDVRVVIVGQDPYHGPRQAQGLSFSVPHEVLIPPSLRNIFKELHHDMGIPILKHGNLFGWASQGVLLLNAILTVEKGKPAAHAKQGWELFTDEIIKVLLLRNQPIVFMLWGAYAQKKVLNLGQHINPDKHLILKAAHPSPLSVRGFLGCRHFSQANLFLSKHDLSQINWASL